jgi:DNA processing protein
LFAERGFVIVSGLAKGCDTVAHRGCLDAHGKTVAILGGGIDYIYPKENRPLADEILNTGGCLLSEYKPGMKPQPSFFVERDRLQSGLSQAVIVIETDVKGGSMHTVGFALSQNRLVACLGGHSGKYLSHPKVQGTKLLISDGKASRLSNLEEVESFLEKLIKPIIEPILLPNDLWKQGKLF